MSKKIQLSLFFFLIIGLIVVGSAARANDDDKQPPDNQELPTESGYEGGDSITVEADGGTVPHEELAGTDIKETGTEPEDPGRAPSISLPIYSKDFFLLYACDSISMESFEGLAASNNFTTDTIVTDDFSITVSNGNTLGVWNMPVGGGFPTDGIKWIVHQSGADEVLSITFNQPIWALGFQLTDYGDNGPDDLIFSNNVGDIFSAGQGGQADGNQQFFGIINPDAGFQYIDLTNTNPSEGYGLDEFYYCFNQSTDYDQKSEFLSSACTSINLESFEGLIAGNDLTSNTIETGDFTMEVVTGSDLGVWDMPFTGGYASHGNNWIGHSSSTDEVLSITFKHTIWALGFNLTDYGDNGSGELIFSNDLGDVYIAGIDGQDDGSDQFFGIINPGAGFKYVDLTNTIAGEFYGLDEFYYCFTPTKAYSSQGTFYADMDDLCENIKLESFEGLPADNDLVTNQITSGDIELTITTSMLLGVFDMPTGGAHPTHGDQWVGHQGDFLKTLTITFNKSVFAFGIYLTGYGETNNGSRLRYTDDNGHTFTAALDGFSDGNEQYFGLINPESAIEEIYLTNTNVGDFYGLDEIEYCFRDFVVYSPVVVSN